MEAVQTALERGRPAMVAVEDHIAAGLHPVHEDRLVKDVGALELEIADQVHVLGDDAVAGPDIRVGKLVIGVDMQLAGREVAYPAALEKADSSRT